jgi:hypothetical protein
VTLSIAADGTTGAEVLQGPVADNNSNCRHVEVSEPEWSHDGAGAKAGDTADGADQPTLLQVCFH